MPLYEQLAAIQHDIWAHWQRYVHEHVAIRNPDGSLTIPAETVRHWESQIRRPYDQLTEREKSSDREQVDKFWSLVSSEVSR